MSTIGFLSSKPRFKSAYNRLVASQLVGESTLIYPLYSIMFSERSHISAAGVGLLLACWQITQILSEVPTGVIADRFSKKYSIMVGRICKVLCFATWFLFPSFGGYLAGFIVWGIGEAFISGAIQAYLYELNEGKKDSTYLKSYSRLKSLEMVAYTITYFFTFLIGPKFQLLVGLSVISAFVSFLITASLPTSQAIAHLSGKEILMGASRNLRTSPALRQKYIEGLAVAGTMLMLIELVTVNYRDFGASVKTVPLLISISTIVSAISYWTLHSYEKFFKKHVLQLLIVFLFVFVALFSTSTWLQIFGLFFVTRFMRVLNVTQESDLLEYTEAGSRATVMSSYSFIAKLISAGQIFLVGILAVNNKINLPTFWFIIGSLLLFAALRSRPVKRVAV